MTLLFAVCVASAAFGKTIDVPSVGPVAIALADAGGWTADAKARTCSDGADELEIALSSSAEATPPKFTVSFDVPQLDAHHKWKPSLETVTLPPDWGSRSSSSLANWLPVVSFINANDRNRMLVAVSEAKRKVVINAGLREEDCRLVWKISFFAEPEAPLAAYTVKLRFDRRDVFFGDAIREGADWIVRSAGLKPSVPPSAAFEPLYSAWYSFHQNVFDREIEAECAEAAKLGMKVLIVDDGWQTDDNNRGYAYTGDWEISKNRFPDMPSHVKKVHGLGMKYMVWFGVPMVGFKSGNYGRFKGKYLWDDRNLQYSCLDPRFPEVRDFICGLYERAVRTWDIDGLKLDFVDAMILRGEDPAMKEGYAGRDRKSLSEAVDLLLKEIVARLSAIKPDILFEFRQSYVGPAIRQYGNMLRASDCPGDLLANRCRIANLRLTSGETAVHSDMLEWNVAETPENAARFIISSIFGVVQYSMMLRTLPAEHKRMMAHWISFSKAHREALLRGVFRPHHFEAMYPVIEGESASERIVGVYTAGTLVELGAPDKTCFVLNGTGTGELVIRAAVPCEVEVFDTFGESQGTASLAAGLNAVKLPVSGYLSLRRIVTGPNKPERNG